MKNILATFSPSLEDKDNAELRDAVDFLIP